MPPETDLSLSRRPKAESWCRQAVPARPVAEGGVAVWAEGRLGQERQPLASCGFYEPCGALGKLRAFPGVGVRSGDALGSGVLSTRVQMLAPRV